MAGAVPLLPPHMPSWSGQTFRPCMRVPTCRGGKAHLILHFPFSLFRIHASISASPTGQIFVKFGICDFYENVLWEEKSPDLFKI
jgi:hypothetical protein